MAKERVKLNAITKRLFQRNGYICEVVEHFNPYAGKCKDLFGFGDLIAVSPSERKVAIIQTTTTGHLSERRKKIHGLIEGLLCARAGVDILIVHWSCKTEVYKDTRGRSHAHTVYEPRIEYVHAETFPEELRETGLERFRLITESVVREIDEEKNTRYERARYPEFIRRGLGPLKEKVSCALGEL